MKLMTFIKFTKDTLTSLYTDDRSMNLDLIFILDLTVMKLMLKFVWREIFRVQKV